MIFGLPEFFLIGQGALWSDIGSVNPDKVQLANNLPQGGGIYPAVFLL